LYHYGRATHRKDPVFDTEMTEQMASTESRLADLNISSDLESIDAEIAESTTSSDPIIDTEMAD
jgi:hypothetical protein